jgi:signal transduction histidine kinase
VEIKPFKKRTTVTLNTTKTVEHRKLFAMDDFYYEEISNLTGAGGWMIDFVQKKSYFDKQAKRILKVPVDFVPTLKNGYKFYAEEHAQLATELFFGCAQGVPFNSEIKMVTYDGTVFWARAYGTPLKDEKDEIVGIRGVFQNIEDEKRRELRLQKSIDLIEKHNQRLYNFAHIVSHNLRSHVSNLQMTADLFETSNLDTEQTELFSNFPNIAINLDTTIKHLHEVVTIQTDADKGREEIDIEKMFNHVVASIKQIVRQNDVRFSTEFSEVEKVQYIPAYLESILLNFITNAIKYRKPDVRPEIRVFTYEEEEKQYLVVEDNGIGIDLDSHGEKIFQLYKTFHNNPDAVGLGLFLTRNQVEALGGKIFVESKVGKGAKFTVQL